MGDYLDLNSIVENFIFLDISLLNKDAKCQIVSLGEKYMLITEGKDKSEDLKTTIELLNKTKI